MRQDRIDVSTEGPRSVRDRSKKIGCLDRHQTPPVGVRSKAGLQRTATAWEDPAEEVVGLFYLEVKHIGGNVLALVQGGFVEEQRFQSSWHQVCGDLIPYCQAAQMKTVEDPNRAQSLKNLGQMVAKLEDFVRRYESIDDDSIDTDDEILNWVYSEANVDLCSSIWLLSSAFYKASASCLRNALDISTACLYFQIKQNEQPELSCYANTHFAAWDSGNRDTPNWVEMKPTLKNQIAISRFKVSSGIDIVDLAHLHFKHLCDYTHSRAYAKNGDPVSAINMTGIAPSFDAVCFERGAQLVIETICLIAAMWQAAFPELVSGIPRFGSKPREIPMNLFRTQYGWCVLSHK